MWRWRGDFKGLEKNFFAPKTRARLLLGAVGFCAGCLGAGCLGAVCFGAHSFGAVSSGAAGFGSVDFRNQKNALGCLADTLGLKVRRQRRSYKGFEVLDFAT